LKPLSKIYWIAILLFTLKVNGQVLIKEIPFSTATPFLEPDGRREVVKVSPNEFMVLSKVKGNMNSESEYLLEKFDYSINPSFKVPIKLSFNEDVYQLYFNGKDIILFTIVHDQDNLESKFLAYAYNKSTGEKLWDKILMYHKVATFQTIRGRGVIEESFENAICSNLSKNFIIPFDYQYYLNFSPDSTKLLLYSFDYSKNNLVGTALVFDKELNKINEGIIPIDNNFINYGVSINNRGEVYIVNADRMGRIVVVQYNLETRDNKLLDIQYSSTIREGLKTQVLTDDAIYVASVNTSNHKVQGVMYAKFDFEKNLVEKINYHQFSEGLQQTADAVHNEKFKSAENWEHYEITNFVVNKFEKVLLVLEKREINSLEYLYQTEAPLEADRWKERTGKVITESVILLSFNAMDDLMWENYYAKSQTADVTYGLTSCSYTMDITDERIRMVYATAVGASGVFNTYNFVEWDARNGNKVKELPLQNDEGLALVRNYCLWWDDQLFLVGRKGLLGKKYIAGVYKFSSGETAGH
jgi:hypothetical protein